MKKILRHTVLTTASAVLACCSMSSVHAQTTRTGNADTRVMQQLQQVTAERSKLQTENGELKQELEEAKKKLTKALADQTALQQRAKQLETMSGRESSATQQNNEALEKSRVQLQELVTKFRETTQSLRDVEADRNAAKGLLGTRERDLKTCVDRNAGLYLVSEEILDRLEHQGVWSSLKQSEPFTKIARTRLENFIDDYRGRVEELRLEKIQKAAAR